MRDITNNDLEDGYEIVKRYNNIDYSIMAGIKANKDKSAAEYLKKQGYMHVVYITFGYEEYAQSQDGFVPEIGECDCLAD